MLEMAESDPQSLILVTADMARSKPPMSSAFVAELQRRLHGHGPALTYPLTWIEQGLAENSSSIEQLIHAETQQQAADQVSIGNSIGSLRFLDSMDWRDFVEDLSVVEQTLRTDPAGIYAASDFATRDACRHVVERTAKCSPLSERDVARAAIELARASTGTAGPNQRTAHVGFYLVDEGVAELERRARATFVAARSHSTKRAAGIPRRFTWRVDLASSRFWAPAASPSCWSPVAARLRRSPSAMLILSMIVASLEVAVALVNQIVPLVVRPRPLMRMDFSKGIPPRRSLDGGGADALGQPREHCWQPGGVAGGLLSGQPRQASALRSVDRFPRRTDGDTPRRRRVVGPGGIRQSIESLNEKYKDDRGDIFFLFHRARWQWNPQERIWMGRERKRGKLGDLNSGLLRNKVRERTIPRSSLAKRPICGKSNTSSPSTPHLEAALNCRAERRPVKVVATARSSS